MGMCILGGKFIKEWQVKNKIIESFFPICIQPFTNYSNSRNNKLIGFGKFTNGYEELCMSEGKFSKPWQVTDKIIEWFILQFITYILWMTQTQEKITCRILKIHKWIWGKFTNDMRGCVWVGPRFLSHDKWHVKLLSGFFYNSYFTFYKWLKLKK